MFTLSSSQYLITFVSTLSYGRHFRNETTPYKQINFIPVSSTTSPSLPPSSLWLLAVLLFFFSPPHWQNFKQNSQIIIQQEQNHEEHTSSNSITSLSCYAIMSTFIPRRHRSPSWPLRSHRRWRHLRRPCFLHSPPSTHQLPPLRLLRCHLPLSIPPPLFLRFLRSLWPPRPPSVFRVPLLPPFSKISPFLFAKTILFYFLFFWAYGYLFGKDGLQLH
jgi:hypothetical protein